MFNAHDSVRVIVCVHYNESFVTSLVRHSVCLFRIHVSLCVHHNVLYVTFCGFCNVYVTITMSVRYSACLCALLCVRYVRTPHRANITFCLRWGVRTSQCVRCSACTLQCVSSRFCRSVMSLARHFVRTYVIWFLKSDDFLHVELHSHNEMNSKSPYDQFQDFHVLLLAVIASWRFSRLSFASPVDLSGLLFVVCWVLSVVRCLQLVICLRCVTLVLRSWSFFFLLWNGETSVPPYLYFIFWI